PIMAFAVASAPKTYDTGDLAREFAPTHAFAAVGCIEMAPSLRRTDSQIVLEWRMGNRCNEPVQIDLRNLAITGRSADGEQWPIHVYDPADEIRVLPLPPRREAFEVLVLKLPGEPVQICIDVSSVAPGLSRSPVACFVEDAGEWETTRRSGS